MFGEYMPGGLAHNGIEYDRLIEQLFLLTDGDLRRGHARRGGGHDLRVRACSGPSSEVSEHELRCSWISACLLTRKVRRAGPAKVAIFASALFGTISGSGAGQRVRHGHTHHPAHEAAWATRRTSRARWRPCASTGGQLMPPIMGAAAFIMADVIGTSAT